MVKMMWHAGLTIATLVAHVASVPAGHVLHEKREVAAHHIERRRVEPEATIPVRIAIKQSNLESAYDRLMEVSHPDSHRYGQHFTKEEVHDMFAPSDESIAAVKDWLISAGILEADINHYENKGWLAIDMPAGQAESLFGAEYHEHDFSDTSMRIGCDEYYLPSHVAPHVDFIKPGIVMSPRVKKRSVKRMEPGPSPGWPGPRHHPWHPVPHPSPPSSLPPPLAACGVNITPICIKALYDIPDPQYTSPENVMGLYESYDAFSQYDLDHFFANWAPYVPQGTTPTVDEIDGGTAPVKVGNVRNSGESDLDLTLAYSLIYPQTITVYQVDDIPNASGETGKAGFLNDFFDAVDGSYCNFTAFGITGNSPKIDPVYPDPRKGGYKGQTMCGTYSFTRVVSISYGESEYYFPRDYLHRQCLEIAKLGMQGHSILNAAGDYGVASFPGSQNNTFGCLSGEGQTDTIYNPDYPSGCPYMTVVGATQLYPNQTVFDKESAMQVNLYELQLENGVKDPDIALEFFSSSGGFSNFFTPADYQKAAIAAYFADHDTVPYYTANKKATNIGENGGLYNRAGRGYPDVSANGAYLLDYYHKELDTWFGTSLASPIFGSVLTLINEERTNAGKGPVGFVNAVLYAHPEVLNDITNGSNPNCGSAGFVASTGWDPVTGLGTPNYPKMLNLFMSLP